MSRNRGLFWITLIAIVALGFAVRASGVRWLKEAEPSANHSIHPDVPKLISIAQNFNHRPGMDGYVIGMSTHLYLVRKLLNPFFGTGLDLAILIRSISLTYGLFTIILISMIAIGLGFRTNIALFSSALLAISPLHVINSHFGTPNASATFYFYLALFAGWSYAKTRNSLLFVLFVALIAASLAMKFFISLLVPLFLVLWLHTRGCRLEKIVTAFIVMAGSFSLFSFFNYTPWQFYQLINMIAFDNVQITGGYKPAEQIGLYMWDSMSALGLGNWMCFVVGMVLLFTQFTRTVMTHIKRGSLRLISKNILVSPEMVYVSAFIAHGFLLILAGIHGIRHLLVFIPIACLISAIGFSRLLEVSRCPRVIATIMVSLLIAYQLYTVINLEKMYTGDIRNRIAEWINKNVGNEEKVGTFSDYSWIKGVQRIDSKGVNTTDLDVDYLVTCSLEYDRYFSNTDAEKIFHAGGGQERLDFYQDLFSGKLGYDVAADFVRTPVGLEQRLEEKGVIRDLGTFTPRRCFIFKYNRNSVE